MNFKTILIVLLAFISGATFAQSRKSKKKERQAQTAQPTTRDPLPQAEEYVPKASRKSSRGATYESEQKYYERMEELEKARRKNERVQDKPQYSDPMYFGHKRPPKKRKPGKMKYCRECGIRH